MKPTIGILTGEKSKLSAAAWVSFMKLVKDDDPIIKDETELLAYAIGQPQGELIRDHAFFEIGFRFALHCLEHGNLKLLDLGDN